MGEKSLLLQMNFSPLAFKIIDVRNSGLWRISSYYEIKSDAWIDCKICKTELHSLGAQFWRTMDKQVNCKSNVNPHLTNLLASPFPFA